MREEMIVHHRVFEDGDILDLSGSLLKEGEDSFEYSRCLVIDSKFDELAKRFEYTLVSSKHRIFHGYEKQIMNAKYRGHVDLSTVFDPTSSPLAFKDEYSEQKVKEYEDEYVR